MSNLNIASVVKGASAADSATVVGLEVGQKINERTGKPSPLYASFRLPGVLLTSAAALAKHLLTMPAAQPIRINLPKSTEGTLRLTLRPVYFPAALAALVCTAAGIDMPAVEGKDKGGKGGKGAKDSKPADAVDVSKAANPPVDGASK